MIPLWVIFGFAVAGLSALILLLQERLKAEGLALAVWCKVACVLATLPFVLATGLPADPQFYFLISITAVLFAVSDVVYFRNIPKIGAGVLSRLMPATVFPGFLLWFAVDPGLIEKYAAQPLISGLIILCFLLATYFKMRLKNCTVSMQALRLIWVVMLAAMLGPLLAKSVTSHATLEQGPAAYTFVQAAMMLVIWLVYLIVARPVPVASLFSKINMRAGLLVGPVMAAMVTLNMKGLYHIDNPGYMTALGLTNSMIILLAHKAMGKKDDSNIRAGLGLVLAAIALIALKSQI